MTGPDAAALVLRVVVASIFLVQGQRKTLAPDDIPHGRADLVRVIAAAGLPLPRAVAWSTGVVEIVGGICVLLGVFTVAAAIALSGVLLGAIAIAKWKAGFVAGWDWPLACLACTIALALLGPGPFSMDAAVIQGIRR